MKNIKIFIPILLLIFFSSCTKNPPKITYDSLSPSKQAVVDKVLEQFNDWESCDYDGKTYSCKRVGFVKKDGYVLFIVNYKKPPIVNEGEMGGIDVSLEGATIYGFFVLDTGTGQLSKGTYDNTVVPYGLTDFSVYDETEEMKDNLARAYSVLPQQ